MHVKDLLQGTRIRHPLHPAIVSLPVGLWSMALVFDLLSRIGDGNPTFVRTSFYSILIGLIAALAAVPTGVADWSSVKPEKPAWRLGFFHLVLNVVVALLFALNLGLRWGETGDERQVSPGQLTLSAIGAGMLWVSVYLGGRMTYEHGISVARHSKQKWRGIAERSGARVPAAKEDQS
jgi:uncharacterized membrane protein